MLLPFSRPTKAKLPVRSFMLSHGASTNKWHEAAPVSPAAKRSSPASRARLPWMEKKLVVSNIASHSATNLCNSNTSWGPDFASPTEGKLCDMSTKTLYTLCSKEQVDGCIEINTSPVNGTTQQRTVATRKLSVAKRTLSSPIRSYDETDVWGDKE